MREPVKQHGHHRRPSRTARQPPPPSSRRFRFFSVAGMIPSTFNIIRASVYSLVFLWSIICLAIAVHFQSVLSASDLTRFVPFAIFVSSASLAIIIVLSAFSVRKNMNPISTRIELGCLGFAGTFWIALGAFLASSDSEEANVECFASETDATPVDGGFSTETYQAQYHVLEAFSLFNAILVWGFLLLLFGLALRQYMTGHRDVWLSPVTTYDWFNRNPKKSKLPAPVTARGRSQRSQSRSKPTVQPAAAPPAPPKRTRSDREKRPHATTQDNQTYYVQYPERRPSRPPRAHTTERQKVDYYRRDASPRR